LWDWTPRYSWSPNRRVEGGALTDDRLRWWFRGGRSLNDDVAPPKLKNARLEVLGSPLAAMPRGRLSGLEPITRLPKGRRKK
jgi:hypothetical protein